MLKAIAKKLSLLMVGVIGAGLVSFSSPGTAEASHYSWIYNQKGSYVKLYPFPIANSEKNKIRAYKKMKNNTKFVMECWRDFKSSFTGNYKSKRWFAGRHWNDGRWGYVHSSYVYYQKKVPRC